MDPPEDKENENEESAPENSQLGDPFDKEPHLKTPERYVIPGYDTLNAKELPENWVKLLHDSGLTMYFNPITGVATLSRPFIVTPESVKSTTIPIFAIPCLNYRYSKFAPKEPLNSKVSDADKSRVDSDTQQQDSSNCEAKKTLECPIRSVEGGGDCDGANANREDASEVADKEKEEGELTTDEDEEGENEGEDAKHGDLPPPTKRLCRRNVKEKTSPVLESNVTSQNENTAQQEAQPEKRVDNNVHNSKLLTPDEVREYCSKLFKFKRTNALTFRNRWERLRFYRAKRGNQRINNGDGSFEDMEGNFMEQRAKERIFRLFDKSPICILHEYCQSVLHVQSTFKPLVVENDKQLFHYAIVINNVTYPTGSGNSKRLARSEAARLALFEMLPEYKAFFEEKIQSGSQITESTGSMLSEADLNLFRAVSVTDRQVYEIVTARQLNCAAPYTIFGEYVKRHCIPESDVHSNMIIHNKNNHIYEISVGEHRVQVSCKNKRIGRNHAAQEMLAKLHPQIKTWADLLELYGPNTKPDRKSDNEAILDAQTRNSNSVKTGVIRILKAKMLELSHQWEAAEDGKRKGKFNVSPNHLPVVYFHPDSATNVYSYPPPDPSYSGST
ncbi:Microprocessor complex subunit DGCR8 [Echinococcus granulosus]|uniref:Microprocessor complex subunit DGCR8 n=1 Tax=Echinococcus granulosus TaxID=6210 RepID=A0A068WTY4_ECHGR|nr:Microprocessor complex subunit DGCR8 [Echinococcus granulosus]CDS23623.1 microprocessor complex subunit DGCR8 [Echinococcus granulosus]